MPAKTLRDVFVEAARGVRSAAACLVTLEQVVKLNIVAECPNCRRMFRDGGCTFVGCHGGSPHPVYHCKATLRVEDGSEEANLFLKDLDVLKAVVRMSDTEWSLVLAICKAKGEFLYLPGRPLAPEEPCTALTSISGLFKLYLELLPKTSVVTLNARVRPFKDSRDKRLFLISVDH